MPTRAPLLLFSLFLISGPESAQNAPEPVTPNASREARTLLREISHISGRNILSGQYDAADAKSTYRTDEPLHRQAAGTPEL